MSSLKHKVIELEQRSPEWFQWREWKIGGSQAAAIMGECPYRTSSMLYFEIVNGIKIKTNPDMQRGIDCEEKALDLFNKEILATAIQSCGSSFKPCCFESVEHPFMIASADGWDEVLQVGLEVKSPRKFSNAINPNGSISAPDKYKAQVQHCLSVTGAELWHYAEYVNGKLQRGVIYRDDQYISRLIQKEKEFHENLMTFSEPAIPFQEFRAEYN